jgi:hypothetical protein
MTTNPKIFGFGAFIGLSKPVQVASLFDVMVRLHRDTLTCGRGAVAIRSNPKATESLSDMIYELPDRHFFGGL